jgi:tRNA G18 (ribose-2'-O)-methylase SpoU
MKLHTIATLDDNRLDPYRHLRTTNLTRFSGRFIAESRPLVQRLLASDLQVESILVDQKRLAEGLAWLPEDVPIYVVEHEAVAELIGFQFHRGFLACGIRPQTPAWRPTTMTGAWTGVMFVGVQDPENLGAILRTCSALGIQDILMGPECVDPFARRVLRVSMGNAFKLRFYDANDSCLLLRQASALGIETVAACLTTRSIELASWHRRGPTLVVLGNEGKGLPEEVIESASQPLRIAMDLGTDSLNVSVAAAILLHYVCRLG